MLESIRKTQSKKAWKTTQAQNEHINNIRIVEEPKHTCHGVRSWRQRHRRWLLNFDPVASVIFWCYRSKIDAIVRFRINFSFDASRCKWSWCNSLSHRLLVVDARSSYCIIHPLSLASKLRDAIAYCIQIMLMQYIYCNGYRLMQ